MGSAERNQIVEFGPFRLHTAHRKLLHGSDVVTLGGRGMDILLALAARQGELVSKQELLSAGWPDTFVQDANLKVTIAYLRRALRRRVPSADFINTVVGRGYWLGADSFTQQTDPPVVRPERAATLPALPSIIGRDAAISEGRRLLSLNRLVTIVGAGGIGKTTVATAIAHRAAVDFGGSVTFVDLSSVASEDFVAASLAAALGISSGSDSLQAVSSILARQKTLLVFDTCEHLLSAVAHICEVLLARTAHVSILATSRELLRVRSEKVLWLAPLDVPPDNRRESIEQVLRYSAPQLLVTRALEKGGFVPQERDARPLGQICRRLDGSPLAIGLIAPRLATRGASAVLDELEDRLLVLGNERRRSPRRHRTLFVALKWSYDLLTPLEARVLRALSVFAGSFSSGSATQVAACTLLSPAEIVDAIAGLRSKSMLGIELNGDQLRYRLLDTSRAFAAEMLEAAGEKSLVRDAHARWVLKMLGRAAADQSMMTSKDWQRTWLVLVDDLRKAIRWTLHRSADPISGIRLVAAGLLLWHELSLGAEIRDNCRRSLAEFRRIGCSDTALEQKLVVGLAAVSTYLSTDEDEARALFHAAVRLARETGDPQAECRALGAFATFELMRCREESVVGALTSMRAAAARVSHPTALWEEGQLRTQYEIRTCAFDTALARAKRLFTEICRGAEGTGPRFQIHQKLNVEIQMAALNWLTGRPREAIRVVTMAATDAREVEHGLTLIHCLAQGVVWTLVQCGEYEAVLPHIATLRTAIYQHGVAAWIPVADTYEAAIAAFLGENPDPACLRSAFYGVRAGVVQIRHDARYAMLAEAMLANNQASDAAEVIQHVFDHSPQPWACPEFLRLKAATLRVAGRDKPARETLVQALADAKRSNSLAWTLRSAHDLAALLSDHGKGEEAHAILAPVYRQFPDNFETRDLGNARELLAKLH